MPPPADVRQHSMLWVVTHVWLTQSKRKHGLRWHNNIYIILFYGPYFTPSCQKFLVQPFNSANNYMKQFKAFGSDCSSPLPAEQHNYVYSETPWFSFALKRCSLKENRIWRVLSVSTTLKPDWPIKGSKFQKIKVLWLQYRFHHSDFFSGCRAKR